MRDDAESAALNEVSAQARRHGEARVISVKSNNVPAASNGDEVGYRFIGLGVGNKAGNYIAAFYALPAKRFRVVVRHGVRIVVQIQPYLVR